MRNAVAQFIGELVQVYLVQQVQQRLGPHLGDELVGVGIVQVLVVFGQCIDDVEVFFLGEQFHLLERFARRTFGYSGVDDDVTLVVDDHIELLGGKPQQVTDLVGQAAEVPDVRYRNH